MAKKSRYMAYVEAYNKRLQEKEHRKEIMSQKSVVGKLKALKAEGRKHGKESKV